MKDITELIKTAKPYQKAIVQKTFTSKKNTVAYVLLNGKPRILKWFPPGLAKNMETEYHILERGAKKLHIPTALGRDDTNHVIIMSYIIGENLCDVINSTKTILKEKERLMVLLAQWFAAFHSFFSSKKQMLIRGDAILQNFILTDRIWGVDFEEARVGESVEDIAHMCSSILSTDPMFTKEKRHLCQLLIDAYQQETAEYYRSRK